MNATPILCASGHDLAQVGVYIIRGRERCKKCQRDGIARSRAKLQALLDHPEDLLPGEVSRFARKIDKSDTCWLWTGADNGLGYGVVSIAGRNQLAHRVSYRMHNGTVAEGLELDHTCRTRRCVNPNHLEPVTHLENMTRAKRFWKRTDSGKRT